MSETTDPTDTAETTTPAPPKMHTLFHPTILGVTCEVSDGQLEEAHRSGWLDNEPKPDDDVTVQRIFGEGQTETADHGALPSWSLPASGLAPTGNDD